MGAAIFISYYRADAADVAQRIGASLEARFGPDSVFIDVADIAGGAQFVAEIDTAIDEASVLLVVVGPRWAELRTRAGFDYVGHEIARALGRGMLVLPVLVNDTPMITEGEVGPDLRPMLSTNAVRVNGGPSYDAGVQQVIDAIRRYMPRPAVLQLVRGEGFRTRLGKATVLIDGEERGDLRPGHTLEHVVEPGNHEVIVTATLMFLRTATASIRVDVGAGETVVVDLKAGPNGWNLERRSP